MMILTYSTKPSSTMGIWRHLVLVKFKEGAAVTDVLDRMDEFVSKMDTVKSFERGQDVQSAEMLRQGFTHAFFMSFDSAEDLAAFSSHPSHLEFGEVLSAAIDKVLLFDFPAVAIKPSA